ncbi:MAG: choice-of-anchor E domain-containing protein [Bryobacteraceae bacterium]|jgi:hypothetical protein
MEQTNWKLQARRCAWLPLMVFCAGLPAHADLLSYTADSNTVSGTWTVTGFDPSKGTLNSVELDVNYGFTATLTSNSTTTEIYNASENIDVAVDQPDGSLVFERSTIEGSLNFLDPGQDATVSISTGDVPTTFHDLATLAEYTAPNVSLAYDGHTSGIAQSGIPGDFSVSGDYSAELTVIYDYTPALSAVPEPTAVLLLGTLAAICLWASRRRLAPRR